MHRENYHSPWKDPKGRGKKISASQKGRKNPHKGKKWEEIVGHEKAAMLKRNLSVTMKRNRPHEKRKSIPNKENNPFWYQRVCEGNKELWTRPGFKEMVRESRENSLAYQNIDHKKASKVAREKIMEYGLPESQGRGKVGHREDIGHFVRSTWEANWCRILNFLGKEYEYESRKCRFDLGELGIIILDTYIPEDDLYVEIKGYLKGDSFVKLRALLDSQPSINLKILDREVYEVFRRKYKPLIADWEN